MSLNRSSKEHLPENLQENMEPKKGGNMEPKKGEEMSGRQAGVGEMSGRQSGRQGNILTSPLKLMVV